MPTVAEINELALDGVAAGIPDAVHSAILAYDTQGAYNAATGAYAETTTTANGRLVVATGAPVGDIFPAYTVGPHDELLWLEGFTTIPEEDWRVTANSITWEIKAVQDVLAAGSAFYVVGVRT